MTDELKDLYDRFKKETEISEKIKHEFADICNFMWEHKLQMIQMEFATNISFKLTMEVTDDQSGVG